MKNAKAKRQRTLFQHMLRSPPLPHFLSLFLPPLLVVAAFGHVLGKRFLHLHCPLASGKEQSEESLTNIYGLPLGATDWIRFQFCRVFRLLSIAEASPLSFSLPLSLSFALCVSLIFALTRCTFARI